MMLAGVIVSSDLVRELIEIVGEPTASVLEHSLGVETVVLALSIEDRERIRALDDPPEGVAELRGVLLCEHEWRRRVWLV